MTEAQPIQAQIQTPRPNEFAKALHLAHEGSDYFFCRRGCMVEFGDDPARFLEPTYIPAM